MSELTDLKRRMSVMEARMELLEKALSLVVPIITKLVESRGLLTKAQVEETLDKVKKSKKDAEENAYAAPAEGDGRYEVMYR